ncbi:MAG: hypothetical protein WC279_12690 [Sulfurimonas sp.]|jgi:hypothetical protein|uniref:hypothetical protein n=1 Tax=Sulfurimonas sp. TaxID=2022749 RepID=UPI003566391E
MNVSLLTLGILTLVSGLVTTGMMIYFLSKKILKPSVTAFIILFMTLITILTGFLSTAQVIEDYRGNPKNNQHITGEDNNE